MTKFNLIDDTDYKKNTEDKISNLTKQTAQYRDELVDIKVELTNMKNNVGSSQQVAPQQVSAQAASSQKSDVAKPYNERQGDVTSDDVRMEDFFSNAHGRMEKKN